MNNTVTSRRNIAVILAGGKGERMGAALPKQLLPVAGRTVLEHTIEAFESHPDIDEICLVARGEIRDRAGQLCRENGWKKVRHIVEGGRERSDSSRAAIGIYEGEDCNLLFHDAVRLLVSHAIISRVCAALREHEAVDVAIPSSDTIIEVENHRIVAVPDRSRLCRTQTPQAFRSRAIALAYRRASRDPLFRATDDCGVLLRYMPEIPIFVVEGEERNIKLTYPDDIAYAERFLSVPHNP